MQTRHGISSVMNYKNIKARGLDQLEEVYQTEKTNDMKTWNIKRIADKDCAIFMWTTDAHIEEAIKLMKAWGFKYVTIAFIWAKTTNKRKQARTNYGLCIGNRTGL